jgi:outer membrane protein assembly factor BamA
VKYYIGNFQFVRYVPLGHGFTLSFLEGIDYGSPLGSTTAIPPYRQFFGGGPDNVRGFRESRLGPKDQFGNPYGGNMRITSQNELIFPMPAKFAQTARVSAFLDMGGVYQTGSIIKFYGPDEVTPELLQFQVRRPETLGGRRGAVAGAARPLPLQPGYAAERQVGRWHHHLGRRPGGVPVLGRQRVLRY